MSDLATLFLDLPRLSRDRTALVLLDMQNVCFEQWLSPALGDSVLDRAGALLQAAREKGILVVHVKVAFQEGYPEISPRNGVFRWLRDNGYFKAGSRDGEIHSRMTPIAGEPVVAKHRVGAFSQTHLDRILQARGIETLIIAGLITSGAVLSAVRQAFDLDYRLIVAEDCCGDHDPATHEMLCRKIFTMHATVVAAADIARAITALD